MPQLTVVHVGLLKSTPCCSYHRILFVSLLQALEVIRELQKHFPIKRSPMKLRIIVPEKSVSSLTEKLSSWNAKIVSKDVSGNQSFTICEIDPCLFRECDTSLRNMQGRLEVLAVSMQEGDTAIDYFDEFGDFEPASSKKKNEQVTQLVDKIQKQTVSDGKEGSNEQVKQNKCSTCDAVVGDVKQYREHFKSEWHKHNLKRKTKQLPPLSPEECMADVEIVDSRSDLKDYSF